MEVITFYFLTHRYPKWKKLLLSQLSKLCPLMGTRGGYFNQRVTQNFGHLKTAMIL